MRGRRRSSASTREPISRTLALARCTGLRVAPCAPHSHNEFCHIYHHAESRAAPPGHTEAHRTDTVQTPLQRSTERSGRVPPGADRAGRGLPFVL